MDDDSKPVDQRDKAFTIPSEVRVELKVPLKKAASDETLDSLGFRPPTVREMKEVADRTKRVGDADGGIFMLSLLSADKLTPVDVGLMNFLDMQICVEALQPFLDLKPRSKVT